MEHKDYNGWTNYETWAVNLWMSNDEGSCRYWDAVAQETYDDAEAGKTYASQTRKENAACALSDRLKDDHEESAAEALKAGLGGVSVFTDLLNAALSEVNWYEIAEHLLDNVTQEPEETEAATDG